MKHLKLRHSWIRVGDIMKLVAIYKAYTWTRPVIDELARVGHVELREFRMNRQHELYKAAQERDEEKGQ